jgi:hypothetical protein
MNAKLETFERAFRMNINGCSGVCDCGKKFYDAYNSYDWEPGEFEGLESGSAHRLEYAVGFLRFEGREYVMDCTCWHARAYQIMGFIDRHAHAIAKYINLDTAHKRAVADASPTVEVEP